MRTIEGIANRLRAEFLEMPGLRLTSSQVQRLCGVEQALCLLGLTLLVEAKFLRVTGDGVYARTTDGGVPRRQYRPPTREGLSGGRITSNGTYVTHLTTRDVTPPAISGMPSVGLQLPRG